MITLEGILGENQASMECAAVKFYICISVSIRMPVLKCSVTWRIELFIQGRVQTPTQSALALEIRLFNELSRGRPPPPIASNQRAKGPHKFNFGDNMHQSVGFHDINLFFKILTRISHKMNSECSLHCIAEIISVNTWCQQQQQHQQNSLILRARAWQRLQKH